MRRASGIQIKNRECIVCQGATASARSKGVAAVEVRGQGDREVELKERSDESKIKMEKKTYGGGKNMSINS